MLIFALKHLQILKLYIPHIELSIRSQNPGSSFQNPPHSDAYARDGSTPWPHDYVAYW